MVLNLLAKINEGTWGYCFPKLLPKNCELQRSTRWNERNKIKIISSSDGYFVDHVVNKWIVKTRSLLVRVLNRRPCVQIKSGLSFL